MPMYALIRSLLFSLPAESSHNLCLQGLNIVHNLRLLRDQQVSQKPTEKMGLSFPNPIGLAAGLDKNADYFEALGRFGFGFIEVGTVTPKPQSGNPKPRLFRLPSQEAIINRMGFNNKGVDYLVSRIKQHHYSGVLGVNVGKNKETPNDRAIDDYVSCIEKVFPYADYITANISSPNTQGLRDLQTKDNLKQLLENLKESQLDLANRHGKHVPFALKIAPDVDNETLCDMCQLLNEIQFDAVIATNTTITRPECENEPLAKESGGLSGAPLRPMSNAVLGKLHAVLEPTITKIAVGGIQNLAHAKQKFSLGADLVQIYSGFIYQGPSLIKQLVDNI